MMGTTRTTWPPADLRPNEYWVYGSDPQQGVLITGPADASEAFRDGEWNPEGDLELGDVVHVRDHTSQVHEFCRLPAKEET